MITLILVVCLLGQPGACHEETPPVAVENPMSCMVQGQQIAAEWVEEHPKWTLAAWKCKYGAKDTAI